ncbi:MAG: epoxide hydrolase 1 [Luminiphilus sp.]|nr:epoxide hydrolase 1 [Luminiphilus sp.]
MAAPITPYHPSVADDAILDLQARLGNTRFPDEETVEDWSQGIPLGYVRELTDYWRDHYDMARLAETLNLWPNFKTELDGLDIHFLYQRSPHNDATPLILTHGWPGSVLEFRHVIDRLTNPTGHGGRAENAFHVVVPSIPGYGFSGKPRTPGTSVHKIAELWIALMRRLGHERFVAHGGDWGALITQAIATTPESPCVGIHITLPVVAPDPDTLESPLPEEVKALEAFNYYQDWDSGYSKQQSTRPQTLGYGLADSPTGQMAWIIEKYAQWCDCERDGVRHPENAVARDELLDTVMMYWLTNAGASSARLYWESFNDPDMSVVTMPTGISLFPNEIFRSSERWAQKKFLSLAYFNDKIEKGGHFAALEVPDTLVQELWQWREALRTQEVLA